MYIYIYNKIIYTILFAFSSKTINGRKGEKGEREILSFSEYG